MSRTLSILILAVALFTTACSSPPVQNRKFRDRPDFHAYVDLLDIPDSWKDTVKQETNRVSGKYINNMITYLELKGDDPVLSLLARYGMKAEIGFDGVDPAPAIQQAVADLIAAGDKSNMYKNDRWLMHEEIAGGEWSEGKSAIAQAAEWSRANDQKRATGPKGELFSDIHEQ